MKFALQDKYLDTLRDDQTLVTIGLNNGVRVLGHIESHDQYVITVTDEVPQMVFKHAIAYIRSQQSVARPHAHSKAGQRAERHIESGIERRVERADRVDAAASPSPAATKTPVIIRKKLRTLAPERADSK